MFRLIAVNFSQKSLHFSLLSPTSPCKLSEREVTSLSNLKVHVVGALEVLVYLKNIESPEAHFSHKKTKSFVPTQLYILLQWQSKVADSVVLSLPHF